MIGQWKEAWRKSQEERLKKEFEGRFTSIKEQYDIQVRRMEEEYRRHCDDLAYEQKRVDESKLALAKCNEDLRQQIKLIEAKASPDQVWVSAFSSGFNSAYASMNLFLQKDVEIKRDLIKDTAYNEAIGRLEPTIRQRLEEVGRHELVPISDILAKKEDFEARYSSATSELEKVKYQSYVKALEWALSKVNGNKLHKD